jgi:hypothetical protein
MRVRDTVQAVLAAGFCALAADCFAQATITPVEPVDSVSRDRVGRVVVPEQSPTLDVTSVRPQRPVRLERPALPPEVQDRVNLFRAKAQAFLDRQQELRKQLLGVNEEDRARIREQMQTLRNQLLEQARQLKVESRDRQVELLEKLRDHRKVIEAARDSAREQLQDAQRQVRQRRGQD